MSVSTLTPPTELERQLLSFGQIPKRFVGQEMVPIAASLAQKVDRVSLEDPTVLSGLRTSRRDIARQMSYLLPVESDYKKKLEAKLCQVEHQTRILEGALLTSGELSFLDASFLSWKNHEGWPAFSVYGIHSSKSIISTWTFSRNLRGVDDQKPLPIKFHTQPLLPQCIERYYLNDTLAQTFSAKMIRENLQQIILTAEYQGVMPDSVRDLIHGYESPDSPVQFEQILIIAEAPEWKVNTVSSIRIGDPLVVGLFKGALWLLAVYDLSPSELVAASLCTHSIGVSPAFKGN